MGAFSLLGTGGYINQYVKARGEPENQAALDLAGFHRIVITFTIGATVLLFGTGAWVATTPPGGASELGVLIVVNLLLASLPVITHFLRREPLRREPPRREPPRGEPRSERRGA